MYKKNLFLLLSLFVLTFTIIAEKPEWVTKLPFTDDAFWGIGRGSSLEEAQTLAKREILMQLSSHVKAAITMEVKSSGGEYGIAEELDSYFGKNTLRGAELEEQYEENNQYWVLMKYCDECGDLLINGAIVRYEEKYNYDSEKIYKQIKNSNITEVYKVERRLKELNLDDYHSKDISVSLFGKQLVINIMNFLPFETDLTLRQQTGLSVLSKTLFNELKDLDYNQIHIVGHANPTGEINEEKDLISLSKNRAQKMTSFLENSGFIVDSVSWKGGDEVIADTTTPEGMSENRRVEIIVVFE